MRDSAGAGVFLDGASALLIDNTWIDNAVDLVQQSCNDEVGEVVGAEDAPTSDICPSPSRLWVPLEFELHLSDGEASTF